MLSKLTKTLNPIAKERTLRSIGFFYLKKYGLSKIFRKQKTFNR
jgi:hypothetical protein